MSTRVNQLIKARRIREERRKRKKCTNCGLRAPYKGKKQCFRCTKHKNKIKGRLWKYQNAAANVL